MDLKEEEFNALSCPMYNGLKVARYGLPDLPVQLLGLCDNCTQYVATQNLPALSIQVMYSDLLIQKSAAKGLHFKLFAPYLKSNEF